MAEAQNQGGTPKRRVVVLGGGPAGVAAAFWLTAPEQQNRYQVTLYTQGWRLGGKCASGRNMACSARIEEHGLHLLIGCYENAFATVRACYAAWTPPPASPSTSASAKAAVRNPEIRGTCANIAFLLLPSPSPMCVYSLYPATLATPIPRLAVYSGASAKPH